MGPFRRKKHKTVVFSMQVLGIQHSSFHLGMQHIFDLLYTIQELGFFIHRTIAQTF